MTYIKKRKWSQPWVLKVSHQDAESVVDAPGCSPRCQRNCHTQKPPRFQACGHKEWIMDPTPWIGFADPGLVLESSLEDLSCDEVEDRRRGEWPWCPRAPPTERTLMAHQCQSGRRLENSQGWLEAVGPRQGRLSRDGCLTWNRGEAPRPLPAPLLPEAAS